MDLVSRGLLTTSLYMAPWIAVLSTRITHSLNTQVPSTRIPRQSEPEARMEAAAGAAGSLLGKLLTKLSDDLVAAYVDSLELGHNSDQIQTKLLHTQGLLQLAEGRDASNVPALPALLEKLSKKADEAEDLLDELHYFKIQDQLDGTDYAAPDLGDGLRGHARHGRHAARHTVGNWFPCFSCSRAQDDGSAPAAAVNSSHHYTTNSATADDGGDVDKLHFDRVAMSSKIKSVINDIHSLCDPVSDLLSKIPSSSTTVTLTRPPIGSTIIQDRLHGRQDIFEKIVGDIISGTHHGQTVSVLPIVGPGGIGKTTFTQHMYNDGRTEEHFAVMVWVCVSTDFDVLKLTQQILKCIPTTENETATETTNLDRLQKSIAQRLKSKRFLIVLDDIWKCNSEDEWKTLLAPFTKGGAKGSMILVTTRFPKLARMMQTVDPVELQGLEPNEFFTFFESCIFGQHKPSNYGDELDGIAREIASKLKGSPLAAKTVGRLLKKNLSREHWNGVLHNHEWRNQKNDNDIIPSLKISYDYLPFYLKKCFSYCALFPEDYRFSNSEVNRFWIAIGIIDSSHPHPSDRNYMDSLVENGFLIKGVSEHSPFGEYYVMHDLMHELSRSVSAQECLNVSDSDFRAEAIPQSIRHVSITIENRYDEKFREEMGKLKGRIDIVNLRTLMIFRQYEESIVDILKDTFKETNGLRILFIAVKSLESLPQSFSKLIHLRYLRIGSPYGREMALPSTLSRFYHLKFLDLSSWDGSSNLPKDISRLVNLHDFLAEKELHSNVPEVGKMKYLHGLKEFHVKKESVGFDLRELGELRELGGALCINNLENVASKEEASGAKLVLKRDLKELTLVWGRAQPTDIDVDIIDALQPHPNLTTLCIMNQGGTTCPSWLCPEISVNNLKTLHLHGVSWGTLPPFGQLPYLRELRLKSISGVLQIGPDYGGVTGKCLLQLKTVVFHDLSDLVEWVVEPNCHMFPSLGSIVCSNCPNLCVLPFSECSCTNLCSLDIDGCPKLSLPTMPHTSTLTDLVVKEGSERRSEMLSYHGKKMVVSEYAGALAFHNLGEVEDMSIRNVSQISWTDLEKLKSLRKLAVGRCDNMFCGELDGSVVFHNMDKVESLSVDVSHLTGKLLSKVFNSCPALALLEIQSSFSRQDQEERVIQFPSSSSLRTLSFSFSNGLILVPAEDGGGIQDIMSLQSLAMYDCHKLLSLWPIGEAGGAPMTNPFPASLRSIRISGESSMWSMALLSNLTSLTHLTDLVVTVDGFNPLITVNLKGLEVWNSGSNSLAEGLLSEVARSKLMHAGSFHLEKLEVDCISAVLVSPICTHLSATLHELSFFDDKRPKGFTEEQENAFQLLTSLEKLGFYRCKVLQSLPQGLHRLSSLKQLEVIDCPELRWLPEQGFPTSLQLLHLWKGTDEQKEQAEKLKEAYPNLRVGYY